MTLLYGLGNNETKYLNTKHNAGRIVLEKLAQTLQLTFQKKNGFWYAKNDTLVLLYSDGYMNHSGQPLVEFCNYFKVTPSTLMVLQDDSDQLCNNQKLVKGGGTAGHNGIISIYQHISGISLEKDDVLRLKIGIRPDGNRLKSETFVLNSVSQTDMLHLQKIADLLHKNIDKINTTSLSLLQNIFNTTQTLA
jgi:peptidyl-tRNA hydrolase, PTH1 family